MAIKSFFTRTAIATLILGMPTAFAATDGSLGATSTGDLLITATIPGLIQISNLDDISLGTYTGSGGLSGSDTVCVYRNGASTYDVTATTSGAGTGSFVLTDGSNNIAYTVTYDDGNGATTMTYGTALTNRQNASTTSTSCGGSTNATVAVSVADADLQGKPAGTYSSTLVLVVAPN